MEGERLVEFADLIRQQIEISYRNQHEEGLTSPSPSYMLGFRAGLNTALFLYRRLLRGK